MLKIENFLLDTSDEISTGLLHTAIKNLKQPPKLNTMRVMNVCPLVTSFYTDTTSQILEGYETFSMGFVFEGDVAFDNQGTCWWGLMIAIPSGLDLMGAFRHNASSIKVHSNRFCSETNQLPLSAENFPLDSIFPSGQNVVESFNQLLLSISELSDPDSRELMGRVLVGFILGQALSKLSKFLSNTDQVKGVQSILSKLLPKLHISSVYSSSTVSPDSISKTIETIFRHNTKLAYEAYGYIWTDHNSK